MDILWNNYIPSTTTHHTGSNGATKSLVYLFHTTAYTQPWATLVEPLGLRVQWNPSVWGYSGTPQFETTVEPLSNHYSNTALSRTLIKDIFFKFKIWITYIGFKLNQSDCSIYINLIWQHIYQPTTFLHALQLKYTQAQTNKWDNTWISQLSYTYIHVHALHVAWYKSVTYSLM